MLPPRPWRSSSQEPCEGRVSMRAVKVNEAVSCVIDCDDQVEVDRLIMPVVSLTDGPCKLGSNSAQLTVRTHDCHCLYSLACARRRARRCARRREST
jgi:hypothetical protein